MEKNTYCGPHLGQSLGSEKSEEVWLEKTTLTLIMFLSLLCQNPKHTIEIYKNTYGGDLECSCVNVFLTSSLYNPPCSFYGEEHFLWTTPGSIVRLSVGIVIGTSVGNARSQIIFYSEAYSLFRQLTMTHILIFSKIVIYHTSSSKALTEYYIVCRRIH